jgi:hypothetical protein
MNNINLTRDNLIIDENCKEILKDKIADTQWHIDMHARKLIEHKVILQSLNTQLHEWNTLAQPEDFGKEAE